MYDDIYTYMHTHAHTHAHIKTYIICIHKCSGRSGSRAFCRQCVTRLLLHAYSYTPTLTRLLKRTSRLCSAMYAFLHAYSYTHTLTRILLHAYSYTPTLTRILLHAYAYTHVHNCSGRSGSRSFWRQSKKQRTKSTN